MDLKITIETDQSDLIQQILDLVKGRSAKVKLEDPKNVEPREKGNFLNELAKTHPVVSIKDPQEWQREIREDRELPI
jgi:hypothetical protein